MSGSICANKGQDVLHFTGRWIYFSFMDRKPGQELIGVANRQNIRQTDSTERQKDTGIQKNANQICHTQHERNVVTKRQAKGQTDQQTRKQKKVCHVCQTSRVPILGRLRGYKFPMIIGTVDYRMRDKETNGGRNRQTKQTESRRARK